PRFYTDFAVRMPFWQRAALFLPPAHGTIILYLFKCLRRDLPGRQIRPGGISMSILKGYTKQEISWMMYDWANSAHSVIIVTILPIFFDSVAACTADSVSSM